MAQSAARSRMFTSRSRRAYRLEMESRTIFLLLSLMVFTGVVVFYLGVVTGMGLRDPNPAPVAAVPAAPQGVQAAAGGRLRPGFFLTGLRICAVPVASYHFQINPL